MIVNINIDGNQLINDEKTNIIEEYIKVSEDYVPFSRKVLMVPESDSISFKREIGIVAHAVPKNGAIPDHIVLEEDYLVPTWEIACNPIWKVEQEKDETFVERVKHRSIDAINRQEDHQVIKTIDSSIGSNHTISVSGYCDAHAFDVAVACVEEHDLKVCNILFHPSKKYCIEDLPDNRKIYNFISSTMIPHNVIYVLSKPECLGILRIKSDTTIMDFYDDKTFPEPRKGLIIHREVGMAVLNDVAAAKICMY